MKIASAQIEGYRSIRERMTLYIEPSVTVLLGPNDHGKTNVLNALLHLNHDHKFANDDLNWDCSEQAETLPEVSAVLSLTEEDRSRILEVENTFRQKHNDNLVEEESEEEEGEENDDQLEEDAEAQSEEVDDQNDDGEGNDDDSEELQESSIPLELIKISAIPCSVVIRRTGVTGKLEIDAFDQFSEQTRSVLLKAIPRFELIDPITKISDDVSFDDLANGKNEFMRGIFYYAGLEPDECKELFEQTDRTQKKIAEASAKLDATLKQSWSQGKNLRFKLAHNSKDNTIQLLIEDPAVSSTYVRASRRSSGFTHYFSLKTILHSRQKDHQSDSHFLLFDEPGVFLHPSGQFDLLQVLETLGMESQVIYVTHSLFMINKSRPVRHRLLMKGDSGTVVDGKPFTGRWKSVISSLGLSLTGSILFANHVLLTEGDSDPVYLYAIIQKAIQADKLDLDINSFSIMSTVESQNTDVLLRILHEVSPKPRVAIITDGDKGGKERLEFVQSFLSANEIPHKSLQTNTEIEDHIPMIEELFVPSLAAYILKIMEMNNMKNVMPERQLAEELLAKYHESFEVGKVTHGLADWASEQFKRITNLKSRPSKVGIAREYANRLFELPVKEFRFDSRSKTLIEWIQKAVELPTQKPVSKTVLE